MRSLYAFRQNTLASRRPLALVSIVALATLALACGGDGSAEGEEQAGGRPEAVSVRVDTARETALVYYDDYPGTVTALEEVEVRPQLGGYITAVHFREGERVRRGQRLYTIDTRRYEASVDQAAARISTARARVALAEKDVARYRRLAEAEAIALQTLDQAEAELTVARQELDAAQAARRAAQTELDYATVAAPITGVTGLASVKVGTQVSPGSPVLTTVSQLAPIGVDFALPQNLIGRFTQLEGRSRASLDSTLRLRLPGDSVYAGGFGRVFALDRAVDPRTGNLTVRLAFENPDGLLRPGMNVEVEVLNEGSGAQVLVSRRALGDQLGERYVYVVQDSIVLRKRVTTGRQLDGDIVVTEGLSGGELVVSAGIKGLRDSARVRIAADTSAAGSSAANPSASATPRR